ncbi:MAG: AI-2E family transporter, partial [Bacteroidota bacterium]
MTKKYPFLFRYVFILLAVILTIYAIIQARDFLYPIAFGVLLSYLFLPVANYLEKEGFPRIVAILICLIFSIIILVILGKFLYQR